jgi:hypothetical protein
MRNLSLPTTTLEGRGRRFNFVVGASIESDTAKLVAQSQHTLPLSMEAANSTL